MSRRTVSRFMKRVCLMIGLVAALGAAYGQVVYPAKFVCGYQKGTIPPLSFTSHINLAYEVLKPGNYATVINVTSLKVGTESLEYYVSIEHPSAGQVVVGPVSVSTLGTFGTAQIGCPDIVAALNPSLPSPLAGEAFEGMVLIPKPTDVFDVQAVYTYASQDQFVSRLALYLGPGDVVQSADIGDEITQEEANVFGATGAGGLGLGASIDVETVLARRTNFSTLRAEGETEEETQNQ